MFTYVALNFHLAISAFDQVQVVLSNCRLKRFVKNFHILYIVYVKNDDIVMLQQRIY